MFQNIVIQFQRELPLNNLLSIYKYYTRIFINCENVFVIYHSFRKEYKVRKIFYFKNLNTVILKNVFKFIHRKKLRLKNFNLQLFKYV